MKDLKKIQQEEIDFWKNSQDESPGSRSTKKILEKASNGIILLECIAKIKEINWDKQLTVLEIGGGQGWASCILKSLHKNCRFVTTDISEYAIASINQWEDIFDTKIDKTYACTSYETNEDDESIDLVFTFAAAHHFLKHRRTLREMHRILSHNGVAAYIFEPVTPPYWYKLAYKRVNSIRPEVHEDVLDLSRIAKISNELGLEFKVIFTPIFNSRIGFFNTVYYMVLNKLPFLQKFFPATATLVFKKV